LSKSDCMFSEDALLFGFQFLFGVKQIVVKEENEDGSVLGLKPIGPFFETYFAY